MVYERRFGLQERFVPSDLAQHLNNCCRKNMKAINKCWRNVNQEIGGFVAD